MKNNKKRESRSLNPGSLDLDPYTDMPTHCIKADRTKNMRAAIKKAEALVSSGGVVAVPTESFYGLAASAMNVGAIQRVMAMKGRHEGHPILLLVGSKEMVLRYVNRFPDVARRLMDHFWPGGLTIVFDAAPKLPALLTGGTGKIGIRLSSHPIPTELARAVGVPITGTSANVTGEPPCRTAEEVLHALDGQVDLILDGGETPGGLGSTVLDVTVAPPLILREGMVASETLEPFF